MKANIVALVVFVPTWLIGNQAGAVDIAEMGVHIPELPDASTVPRVIRRLEGYEAIIPVGQAELIIARLDDAVPPNSDIKEASFRGAQQAEFYEQPDPRAHEHASAVSGHDAWTILSAKSGGFHTVNYRCVTYTIVDQHLYRLVASASGGDKVPPDFVAAGRMMSQLTLGPVDRSSTPNVAAVGLLKMPKPRVASDRDWYPDSALRGREEGPVDLEFSIDSKGRTRDVHETYSDSDKLGSAAQELVRNATYQVKPGWEQSGYQKLRFPLEVQFSITKDSSACPPQLPPRIPGAEVWRVCRPLIPPKFP